jgi:hypothetical protein
MATTIKISPATFRSVFLTLEDADIVMYGGGDEDHAIARGLWEVREVLKLVHAVKGTILCSSSIDHPSDYTHDPAIHAFCKNLI